MAVKRSDARVMRKEEGTIGGTTYYVRLKGEKVRALCFRKMKNQPDMRCTHEAGYRTDHLGTGACRFHGGAPKMPAITNGMTAHVTRMRLQNKIDDYLGKSRDELLDLTQHLAATRAIFDEFMGGFPNVDDESYGIWFNRFNVLITTLGTLVEKISRIDSRNTLTAAQVLYLRATMIDVLMKYVPDPDQRERVVKEIAYRMGGDLEVSMKPSEVSTNVLIEGG